MTTGKNERYTPPLISASDWFRIVAPVNRIDEVQLLAEVGAKEIYCGVLPSNWSEKYGNWDSLSRRQGNIANLSTISDLVKIAEESNRLGMKSSLTLNGRYTADQIPEVLDIAHAWELAGGTSIVASNLSLFLALQKESTNLRRHVSVLANLTNSKAVEFYLRFGISRVILPRELSLSEMESIIRENPEIEYEAMALNEKCRFIDGLCGFYHGTVFPDNIASVFTYKRTSCSKTPITYANDLCYAGHGCQIQFVDEKGFPIPKIDRDDLNEPACAICSLIYMRKIGLRFLKIGGRGLPTELKIRAISFLCSAINLVESEAGAIEMKRLYKASFGHFCHSNSCYYKNNLNMKS